MEFQDHCASLSALLHSLSRVAESGAFDPQPILRNPNAEKRNALEARVLSASAKYESQLGEIEQVSTSPKYEMAFYPSSRVRRTHLVPSPLFLQKPWHLCSTGSLTRHRTNKDREPVMQAARQWRDTVLQQSTMLWNWASSSMVISGYAGNFLIPLILSVPHKPVTVSPSTCALVNFGFLVDITNWVR